MLTARGRMLSAEPTGLSFLGSGASERVTSIQDGSVLCIVWFDRRKQIGEPRDRDQTVADAMQKGMPGPD